MIRVYDVVLKENLLGSPFAPNLRSVLTTGAILGAAAIGAAASGLASGLNASSVASTNRANQQLNEANIEMQRETNKQNYQMFQEQMAYNTDMWNKTNAYNAPAAQVQRLLAAGINPSSFFGSASEASQVTAPNAPQNTAPKNMFQMQAQDFSGLSDVGMNAVNALNATRLANAEVRNKEALTGNTLFDTSFKKQAASENLKYLQGLANEKGYLGDLAREQLKYVQAVQQYEIDLKFGDLTQQKKSYELLEQQLTGAKLQNEILDIQKGYSKQLNEAQLASLWNTAFKAKAEIGLINANESLTLVQKEHEITKRIGTIIDNGMKGVDFVIKKATKGVLIDTAKETLYGLEDARYQRPFQMNRESSGKLGEWFPNQSQSFGSHFLYEKNRKRDFYRGGFYHVP